MNALIVLLLLLTSLTAIQCFSGITKGFAKGFAKGFSKSKPSGFGTPKSDPMSPHTLDTSPQTTNLVNFINKNDGMCEKKAKIGYVKNAMRGLICTSDIKKGETICSIPSSIALALSDPSDSSSSVVDGASNYYSWYVNGNPSQPVEDYNKLTIPKLKSLLDVRGVKYRSKSKKAELVEMAQGSEGGEMEDGAGNSMFSPYLNSLPTPDSDSKMFTPTPDFFTTDEIRSLEFPKMVEMTLSRVESVRDVAVQKGIAEDVMRYYTWIVSSRSFNIRLSVSSPSSSSSESAKSVRVLLPYLDMINHSPSSNAELDILDPEIDDSTFVIKAKRNIRAGQEVTIAYGSGGFSSLDMFGDYGFVDSMETMSSDPKNVQKGPLARKAVTPDERMMDKEEKLIKEEGVWGGWTTTIEEDIREFEDLEPGCTRARVLQFRIKLKRAGGWH